MVQELDQTSLPTSNIVPTFLAVSDDDDVQTLCDVFRDDSHDEDEDDRNDDIDNAIVEVRSIVDTSKLFYLLILFFLPLIVVMCLKRLVLMFMS